MLKMLYVDTLCPTGHKVFNSLTISALMSLDAELTIVGNERCLPENISIAYRIPAKYLSKRKSRILSKLSYRINEYQKLRWLVKVIEKERPDLVILSSYETISLSIVSKSLKIPVLAFNHNNIDELGHRLKRYFYRRIGGNITQGVFENYMADYLKHTVEVRNKVIVLPHIVEPTEHLKLQAELPTSNSILLFAPSSSNDFSLIEDLLKRADELRSNGIKLAAKFKEDVDQDSIILRKRFSEKEYDSFLRCCSAVCVPLRRSFNYRVSNVVNEAIANGKSVLITKNRYSSHLKNRFPSLFYIINNIIEESEPIRRWVSLSADCFASDRKRFLHLHSKRLFAEKLGEFLNGL